MRWDAEEVKARSALGCAIALAVLAIGCSGVDESQVEPTAAPTTQVAPPGRVSPTDDEVEAAEPSEECTAAMREAASSYNTASDDDFAALVTRALEGCAGTAAWFAAAREHPGALGLVGPEFVDDLALQGWCYRNAGTSTCRDAIERGIVRDESAQNGD